MYIFLTDRVKSKCECPERYRRRSQGKLFFAYALSKEKAQVTLGIKLLHYFVFLDVDDVFARKN